MQQGSFHENGNYKETDSKAKKEIDDIYDTLPRNVDTQRTQGKSEEMTEQ